MLRNGAVSQRDYDELVPYLLERPADVAHGAELITEHEQSPTSSVGGSFTAEGHRVVVYDGYLQVQMHGIQVLLDESDMEYTVYVLRCEWSRTDGSEPATWLVSRSFSEFARLDKDLKRQIPLTIATLPCFPSRYGDIDAFGRNTGNSIDRVEECKRGLDSYIGQALAICARLPGSFPVPGLDRFLRLSRHIEQIHCAAANAACGADAFEGPTSGAEMLAAREIFEKRGSHKVISSLLKQSLVVATCNGNETVRFEAQDEQVDSPPLLCFLPCHHITAVMQGTLVL